MNGVGDIALSGRNVLDIAMETGTGKTYTMANVIASKRCW
ncbi:DEAD/DEAH box helicase family protein, partial [Kingella kingae]